MVAASSLYLLGFTLTPADRSCRWSTWASSGWGLRQRVVIRPELRALDVSDFTVPVRIGAGNEAFWNQVQPDGRDVMFADCDGGVMPFEVESFDSEHRSMVAWVRIPRIGASASRDAFYLYYGNKTTEPSSDPHGTWNDAYRAVFHLQPGEIVPAGLKLKDSVSGEGRAIMPGVGPEAIVDGMFSKGLQITAAAPLRIADSMDWTFGYEDWTVELWLRAPVTRGRLASLVSHGPADAFNWFVHSEGFLGFEASNSRRSRAVSFGASRLTANTWSYLALARSHDRLSLSVNDAVYENTDGMINTIQIGDAAEPFTIAGGPYGGIDAVVDEIRISRGAARSVDWTLASLRSLGGTQLEPQEVKVTR